MKRCRRCDIEKLEEDFPLRNLGAGGHKRLNHCKSCVQIQQICSKFGITEKEYHQLFKAHEYRCAICRQPCSSGRQLAIDHDHETGEIRGLLCGVCNRSLGGFQDDPELLKKDIDYLS